MGQWIPVQTMVVPIVVTQEEEVQVDAAAEKSQVDATAEKSQVENTPGTLYKSNTKIGAPPIDFNKDLFGDGTQTFEDLTPAVVHK